MLTTSAYRTKTIKAFVLSIVFLNALGTGLLIPVVPRLVEELTGRGPQSASFENGFLLSVYAAVAFLLSPFLGRLSDRYGRRRVLLLATAGTFCDYALCAVAHSFPVLLLARVLAGAFGASTAAAGAALIDITPPEDRSRVFGLRSAVMGFGLIFGPVLGGSFMEIGLRVPFIAACALAICEFLFGLFWFPETLQNKSSRPISWSDINPLSSMSRLRSLPFSKHLLVGVAFFQLGGTVTQSVLVLFTQAKFGWNGVQVGALMTTLACTSVVIRYAGVRLALAVLGESASIVVGLSVFAAGSLALAFVQTGWQVYAALIFGQLGTIAAPVMLGLMSRSVSPEMQGEAMGSITSVAALAEMAAPLIGALSFGGLGSLGVIQGGELVFVVSAALLAMAAVAMARGILAQSRTTVAVSYVAERANKAE